MGNNANLSVNQQPAYGDKKAISEFESGMKPAPISGAMVPDTKPGRPPVGGQAEEPAAGSAGVSPDEFNSMTAMAKADEVRQWWEDLAARHPNSWTKMYAQAANGDFEKIAERLYKSTPDFE